MRYKGLVDQNYLANVLPDYSKLYGLFPTHRKKWDKRKAQMRSLTPWE